MSLPGLIFCAFLVALLWHVNPELGALAGMAICLLWMFPILWFAVLGGAVWAIIHFYGGTDAQSALAIVFGGVAALVAAWYVLLGVAGLIGNRNRVRWAHASAARQAERKERERKRKVEPEERRKREKEEETRRLSEEIENNPDWMLHMLSPNFKTQNIPASATPLLPPVRE